MSAINSTLNIRVATQNVSQGSMILVHKDVKQLSFGFYNKWCSFHTVAHPCPQLDWFIVVKMYSATNTGPLRELALTFGTFFETCFGMGTCMKIS
jgi:hypothetical protein